MITLAQADAIAEEILSQERALSLEAKNAAARRIPFYYRCPELKILGPWQRAEVVREAELAVKRNWRVSMAIFFWIFAWVSGRFFLTLHATQSEFLVPFLVTCIVPLVVVRTVLVRRNVKNIANSYASSR